MAARPLALKLLDRRRVSYEAVQFDPAARDALIVASLIGRPPASVYKTLVVEAPPVAEAVLVMLGADHELDLKALAAALGVKRARMASHRDAERLTGLQVGGISALALTGSRLPVILDSAARELACIFVSAGRRGWDVGMKVDDLVTLTGARWADVGRPAKE